MANITKGSSYTKTLKMFFPEYKIKFYKNPIGVQEGISIIELERDQQGLRLFIVTPKE